MSKQDDKPPQKRGVVSVAALSPLKRAFDRPAAPRPAAQPKRSGVKASTKPEKRTGPLADFAPHPLPRAPRWSSDTPRTPQVSGASRLEKSLVDLLAEILRFEQAADRSLSLYFKSNSGWGPRERGTLADATFDVLRNLSLYKHWATTLEPGGELRRMAILGLRVTDWLPRLSEVEARWLERVAGSEVAELPLQIQSSLPDWIFGRLSAQAEKLLASSSLSDVAVSEGSAEGSAEGNAGQASPSFDLPALMSALLKPASFDIRVNTSKTDRESLVSILALQGIQTAEVADIETALEIEGHPSLERSEAFRQGLFEVQDRGSQLLTQLCAPKRGQTVVDFCAGAGGKTLAMADQMRSTGQVYACDTSKIRLARLKPRLARSGVSNVQSFAIDSETDPKLKRMFGKADLVLVDAPCSGTGTLRRNPDLKWRGSNEALARLQALQGKILQSASQLVKPGGSLVYATCSLLDDENIAIAERFEALNPGFTRAPASEWIPERFCEGDFLRLWPNIHGSDGFFGAKWVRTKA
jgi:16S rRNA (cytosine967-C5)-methyltransferase